MRKGLEKVLGWGIFIIDTALVFLTIFVAISIYCILMACSLIMQAWRRDNHANCCH
jgi:hypothetical protein